MSSATVTDFDSLSAATVVAVTKIMYEINRTWKLVRITRTSPRLDSLNSMAPPQFLLICLGTE